MATLTPRETVAELDKYVHRPTRRQALRGHCLAQPLAQAPGARAPARRDSTQEHHHDRPHRGGQDRDSPPALARLADAPFLKVEASKFTEVGYVGRDVESMIRDLTELAINMVKAAEHETVRAKARELAEERLLDILLPPRRAGDEKDEEDAGHLEVVRAGEDINPTRSKLRRLLHEGKAP